MKHHRHNLPFSSLEFSNFGPYFGSRISRFEIPRRAISLVLVTAIAVGCFAVPAVAQEYVYQPDRDYYHNDQASGTFLGGAMGAITGALIGGKKNGEGGALIGAGVGALTGNAMGRAKDRADEQRAAVGQASVAQLNQQAAATAITNFDLVEMTRAGVGDEVIISTMRARGTRLDLSPSSLITLKQNGVSDRVVLVAQQMNGGRSFGTAGSPVVVREVTPAPVVVAPAPYYYDYGPRYEFYYGHVHPHHYHHRPRTRVHYSVGVGF